ncbi:Atrial natriuretic peptide receptor 2 [Hypsibius exemplaris]|uniref:guanylate cyclase n=1 Tax=Hypsibius exemplaris TaxID=2072580 RepID=A0A1W0WBV5_HYPEX|nr:Atrial natriuretic peptide receptor 2 [Hypsibius exemplaris]
MARLLGVPLVLALTVASLYAKQKNCSLTIFTILPINSDLYLDVRVHGPGVDIAAEDVRRTILPGCNVTWLRPNQTDEILLSANRTAPTLVNKCERLQDNVVRIVSQLYFSLENTSSPLAAVVGTGCSLATLELVDLAARLNIIVLEASGVSTRLDNKTRYTTLIRAGYKSSKVGRLVEQFMQRNNWTDVVVVHKYDRSVFTVLSSIADELRVEEDGIKLNVTDWRNSSVFGYDYPIAHNRTKLDNVIREIREYARVVVLVAPPTDIRQLMLRAHSQNFTADTVFIAVAYFKSKSYIGMPLWNDSSNATENEQVRQSFRSLFLLKQAIPETPRYREFAEQVENRSFAEYGQHIYPEEEVNPHAVGYHDIVIAYAETLNRTLKDGLNVFDAKEIARNMKNKTYTGGVWPLNLDSNGDLIGSFELWSFNYTTADYYKVIDFPQSERFIRSVGEIDWVLGHAPPNTPKCGFRHESHAAECVTNHGTVYGYAAGGTVVAIILMGLVFSLTLYAMHRSAKKRDDRWWEVFAEEMSRIRIKQSRANFVGSTSSSLAASEGVRARPVGPGGGSAVNTAELRSQIVFITPIAVGKQGAIHMTSKTTMELEKLRTSTKCDKLVRVIGICCSPHQPVLIYEYCPRGDVYELIQNSEMYTFITDWNLRLSLIKDMIEGLAYIHHSWIHFHGKLRSSKCLMDQRFVVKITDYCLRDLRPASSAEKDQKKQTWVAPELLNLPKQANLATVPVDILHKADIYSLGIIMLETVWLSDPIKPDRHWTLEQTAEKIEKGPFTHDASVLNIPQTATIFGSNILRGKSPVGSPLVGKHAENVATKEEPPARAPQNVPHNQKSKRLIGLIASCLLTDPVQRPDISTVQSRLLTIAGGEAKGVADNLISRMSTYAEELEHTVMLRTHELQEEQRKIESLLFELLPRAVATSLISGMGVDSEAFDLVTVLFSCVDDFGELVSSVNPLDVIVILNELYNMIDEAITAFDCYKVETIADVYMVASGLPLRNGNLHVSEIAYFALHLLKIASTFSVRPKPNHKFRLKIGFHTGACMAGVIGHKMPRYCLFGDTINTASRMQSSSEGGKIQISDTAKEFLQQQREGASFSLTPRGLVMVKGKGEMQTYWLKLAHPLATEKHDHIFQCSDT